MHVEVEGEDLHMHVEVEGEDLHMQRGRTSTCTWR